MEWISLHVNTPFTWFNISSMSPKDYVMIGFGVDRPGIIDLEINEALSGSTNKSPLHDTW